MCVPGGTEAAHPVEAREAVSMGKDYIIGEVYADNYAGIWDIAFPRMGGTPEFQVFEDLDTVRLAGVPVAQCIRLPNGMYLDKTDRQSRFWYDIYTVFNIRDRQPEVTRYLPAGPKRDALERETRKRGGGVMVRGGDDPAGVMYFHDDMLKDLIAMIVKAIENPKASERRSCRCPAPAKKRAKKR